MMSHLRRICHFFCVLCCFLILLSACGQAKNTQSNVPAPPSPMPTSILPVLSTPTQPVTPTPTLPDTSTQTCPAQGSARPASLSPLSTGKIDDLIYIDQQANGSTLMRYDVATATSETLLQLDASSPLSAIISPDGQWILMVSSIANQSALQLMRVDGQMLQTLYCAPVGYTVDTTLFSPDQHFLVFNQITQDENRSDLDLLDLTTGQLRTLLSPAQAGYPQSAFAQPGTDHSLLLNASAHGMTPLNPRPTQHYLIFTPLQWKDATSLYLAGGYRGSPAPQSQLYLLLAINQSVGQQQSNIQLIPIAGNATNCGAFDVMPDSQRVVCSIAPTLGLSTPNIIQIEPIAGGASQVLYRNPAGALIATRAITNSLIIFIMDQPDQASTLWQINTDGSGLTELASAQASDDINFQLTGSSLPCSTISPDGTFYALQGFNSSSGTQSLFVGRLNVASTALPGISVQGNNSELVGWAQY